MPCKCLLLLAAVVALGCQRESTQPVASVAASQQSSSSGAPTGGLLGPGADAPELAAEGWINGKPPSKEQLRGKVVVVDTWAYW